MSELLKTEALVLYNMRWSDTSKIVHLFTAEKGYVKTIARGAMRPKSQLRGVVENLNYVEVILSIKETRGLQIISQAELINPFINIRENLEMTAVVYAIAELLKALIHYNEEVKPLFTYTIELIKSLNQKTIKHPVLYLSNYIIYLSEYLGFGWNFTQCRQCDKMPEKFPVKIDVVNGSVYCRNCFPSPTVKTSTLQREQWQLLKQLQIVVPTELSKFLESIAENFNYQSVLDILLSHLNYHTEQTLELKSLKIYLP
jgi:DNA repair protein RecO (recombination protein O)